MKVLSDNGRGDFSWLVEALDWVEEAADLRPSIVSASLGGKGTWASMRTAIDAVTRAGVMVVVAAGNENDNACHYTPAYVGSAITVGSTTRSDERSDFSNHGRCLDIFAPGSAIKSAGHKGDTASKTMWGTSMACPHVAGAAALLYEVDPTMEVSKAEQRLKDRATAKELTDTKNGSPNLLLFVGSPNKPPNPAPPKDRKSVV